MHLCIKIGEKTVLKQGKILNKSKHSIVTLTGFYPLGITASFLGSD